MKCFSVPHSSKLVEITKPVLLLVSRLDIQCSKQLIYRNVCQLTDINSPW